MTEFLLNFQRQDSTLAKSLEISSDWKLSEYRVEIQMLLELPENLPCQFVLERTGEVLKDYLTFGQAGIQEGDKLILIPPEVPSQTSNSSPGSFTRVQEDKPKSPPASSLVAYKLELIFVSDDQQTKTYEYFIDLDEDYENTPERFFSDYNQKERQKFEASLKEIAPREIKSSETDKILREWCAEIALGYRTTGVKI
jgi:hypothetical protein